MTYGRPYSYPATSTPSVSLSSVNSLAMHPVDMHLNQYQAIYHIDNADDVLGRLCHHHHHPYGVGSNLPIMHEHDDDHRAVVNHLVLPLYNGYVENGINNSIVQIHDGDHKVEVRMKIHCFILCYLIDGEKAE